MTSSPARLTPPPRRPPPPGRGPLMLAEIDPTAIVTVIVGAGGATFIGAAVKAVRDVRQGARTRDRDTVGSLREQRDEAERRDREKQADIDYYVRVIGRLSFQLHRAGIEPATGADGLIPPSMRAALAAEKTPPARARRPRTTRTRARVADDESTGEPDHAQ